MNTPRRLPTMGRILSGRHRGLDVANPTSGGEAGRCRRAHVKRDVELVADDMITILRMSPDDRLKEHVRRQVARVVEYDGGHVGAGAVCGGGNAAAVAAADEPRSPLDAGMDGGGNGGDVGESDAERKLHDFEDELWGD